MRRNACFLVLPIMVALAYQLSADAWRESTVADFTDGFFNANIFASCEGNDSGTLKSNPGAFYDLNKDGRPDLVISNMHDNYGNFNINSYIYWGKHDWTYSADSCQALPTWGATGNSVEDLDKDGHLDILFSCYAGPFSIIYWGGKNGFHEGDTTLLATDGAHGNYIADLNHDGRLDIVIANFIGSQSYIYWADKHHSRQYGKRTELNTYGASDIALADLDKDGVLDIVISNRQGTYPPVGGFTFNLPSYIFYGQRTGDSTYYDNSHKDSLATHGAYCASVGDIDKNGWLDLVFSNIHDGASYNIKSYVYYGSSSGFTVRVDLATKGAIGNNIVDLDRDGNDDIVFANWYDRDSNFTTDTHDVPTYVYWGPDFASRTDLPSHGAHGALVGKISSNNVNDVLITNSVIGPGFNGTTFHTWSYIYHGVGRTGYDGIDSIPSYYGHISTKDNGNVHNRDNVETYKSSIFGDGVQSYEWIAGSWAAIVPDGSSLAVFLRTGNTPDPEDGSWSPWEEAAVNGGGVNVPDGLYAQYRLDKTANGFFEMPMVDEVALEYNVLTGVGNGASGDGTVMNAALLPGFGGVGIKYTITVRQHVSVAIYSILGGLVSRLSDGIEDPGSYTLRWEGRAATGARSPSGIYLCRITCGGRSLVKKVPLVR